MIIFSLIFIHWYSSLFFQTFFLHRYASHNMFKMNWFWERTFYLLTFIFQGSSFLQPAAYAVMHRKHHAYADTEQDPHSPKFERNIFKFNKRTFLEYNFYVKKFLNNEMNVLDVPRWPFIEKIAELFFIRVCFVIIYIYI